MKIFITGATGFIGITTVKKLNTTHHELYCLVRKSSHVDELKKTGANLLIGDVTDKKSLNAGMKGCDVVINLANLYSYWEPYNRIYRDINIEGTRNVMEAALEEGIQKVLHISSVVIYGLSPDIPFTEASPIGEHQSEYARTKYEGDQIAWDLHEKRGLPLAMIYPCAVFGPDDPKATGDYIKRLIKKQMPIKGMENCVITCVHVNDVAEAIIKAMEKDDNIGEKYIVGKEQVTWSEINSIVSEISGVPLPFLSVPNFVVKLNATLLTFLANIIKRPPAWGMATDAIRGIIAGLRADGTKAERELGITYTPIRTAITACIESFQHE